MSGAPATNNQFAIKEGCAVCGMPFEDYEARMQPYPPNGDWVHDDGADGCHARYWSAPSEFEEWGD